MPVELPIAETLLGWYDRHRRDLPWRRDAHDPYRVWLSEIMLQQTTVAAVRPYYAAFTARWPTVAALAEADDAEVMEAWAGLGYYARARNLLACARAVMADRNGMFPESEAALRGLPGIGRYTAAALAAIAFGQRAVVVDGNVERVMARLFAVATPLPAAQRELYRLTDTVTPERRAGDFAQALMDLGSTICTPRAPSCTLCPVARQCRAAGPDAARFPVRPAKPVKPRRMATAWWIEEERAVLLVRRPAKGLLGGMLAFPSDISPAPWTPIGAARRLGAIEHVFTHFALTLTITQLALDKGCNLPPDCQWWRIDRLDEAGLPSVFAKVAQAVREMKSA